MSLFNCRITKLQDYQFCFLILMLWLNFQAKAQVKLDSCKITITNVGNAINTSFDEFAPVISADGLMMIFTSNHPMNKGDNNAVKTNKPGMENIYVSYFNEKIASDSLLQLEKVPKADEVKKWTQSKMLEKTVNQPRRNNSATALSNDGQRMLLYRGDPDGDIYESVLKGSEWTEPIKLPEPINSDKYESSASISPDGRTIYFVSDRKGGQGGMDVWLCHQDNNGNWEKVENLGPDVNTPQNEECVFMHPDGKTLYFSSRGHNPIGGYDVFKSTLENGKWSKPVNIGAPVNTIGDDLFFVLTADGQTGYYTSASPGDINKKDIYSITFNYFEKKKNESRLTLFKGVVIDYDSFEPIGADIKITDNDKNETIAIMRSNSVTGKFLIALPAGKNYGIAVKREGYLFYSENFNTPGTGAYKVIDKHVPLQKLNVGSKIILKNVFYDYGKATLRPESVSELNQLVNLMNINTSMKIEIDGFTDNQGSDEFNLSLSQARSQSVVDFLFAAGISKERMVAKGMGKSNPIAANDTEEGRQLNRRTEFKILNK